MHGLPDLSPLTELLPSQAVVRSTHELRHRAEVLARVEFVEVFVGIHKDDVRVLLRCCGQGTHAMQAALETLCQIVRCRSGVG